MNYEEFLLKPFNVPMSQHSAPDNNKNAHAFH